jgi:hypothetical protein
MFEHHSYLRTRPFMARRACALITTCAAAVAANAVWSPTLAAAAPPLGQWTELSANLPQPLGGTPAVLQLPDGRAYVLWLSHPKGSPLVQTYYVDSLSPYGTVTAGPASIFGTDYWQGLSWQPTLVAAGSAPLVVFEGGRSTKKGDAYGADCVVGALGPTVPWSLQTWSLTNPCGVVPPGGATALKGGAYSAEQVLGNHLFFMLHQEPGVPPSTKLPRSASFALPYPTTAGHSAELTDAAGSGDVFAAWSQIFAKGGDGLYVKDLSTNGPILKAPGSGQQSAEVFFPVWGNVALASTNTHSGVFLAYCSNTPNCNVLLWRVGAAKAMTTPAVGLNGPGQASSDMAISAGPGGRLWLAWETAKDESISVVRTNETETAFGPVRTYPTPCWGYSPLIGLGGGSWGRLDVAVQCTVAKPKIAIKDFVTQVMVPLDVSPTSASFDNLKSHSVTFRVTDVGDPVPGATVAIPGKGLKATTGPSGEATVTFPAGMAAGHYNVIITAPNYLPAHATVVVTLPAIKKLLGH